MNAVEIEIPIVHRRNDSTGATSNHTERRRLHVRKFSLRARCWAESGRSGHTWKMTFTAFRTTDAG